MRIWPGFPLHKAEAYVKLRAPFCINDLTTEHILRHRVKFYDVLKAHGIPTPIHVIVDRDSPIPPSVIESEDSIEVNGVKLIKPFVEKPFDAENHDIYIYYPRRLGGGSKRLFRKVWEECIHQVICAQI
jgi:inositol hexakisphosphate/diphosphoinositol-pentakisphosphate kinase